MARSDAIVLVMELCECDLDHLIKVKPFNDKDIVVLLHQLGKTKSVEFVILTVNLAFKIATKLHLPIIIN